MDIVHEAQSHIMMLALCFGWHLPSLLREWNRLKWELREVDSDFSLRVPSALDGKVVIISANSTWFPWRHVSVFKFTFNTISFSICSLPSGSIFIKLQLHHRRLFWECQGDFRMDFLFFVLHAESVPNSWKYLHAVLTLRFNVWKTSCTVYVYGF